MAVVSPLALSAATMRGTPLPRLSALLGPASERAGDPLARLIGAVLMASLLLAFIVALGLVFDPRYPRLSVRAAHRDGGAAFGPQSDDAAAGGRAWRR
ncbi:MAG: hypothetical protein WDN48_17610 [Pseudolabrys sp.]